MKDTGTDADGPETNLRLEGSGLLGAGRSERPPEGGGGSGVAGSLGGGWGLGPARSVTLGVSGFSDSCALEWSIRPVSSLAVRRWASARAGLPSC